MAQHLRVNTQLGIRRLDAANAHGINGSLAADAAARARKEIALRALEVQRFARLQLDSNDVAVLLSLGARGIFDGSDLLAALNQPFGKQKPRGKFQIVPRRAHGDAQREFADTDFERLFTDQVILEPAHLAAFPFGDKSQVNAARARHRRGASLDYIPSKFGCSLV